jgi:hypothetical protein
MLTMFINNNNNNNSMLLLPQRIGLPQQQQQLCLSYEVRHDKIFIQSMG